MEHRVSWRHSTDKFLLITNLTHFLCIYLFPLSTCFEHHSAHHQEIERLPETCRVVIPIKLEFSASVGFIHKESVDRSLQDRSSQLHNFKLKTGLPEPRVSTQRNASQQRLKCELVNTVWFTSVVS
jgi:hypothetical protein